MKRLRKAKRNVLRLGILAIGAVLALVFPILRFFGVVEKGGGVAKADVPYSPYDPTPGPGPGPGGK